MQPALFSCLKYFYLKTKICKAGSVIKIHSAQFSPKVQVSPGHTGGDLSVPAYIQSGVCTHWLTSEQWAPLAEREAWLPPGLVIFRVNLLNLEILRDMKNWQRIILEYWANDSFLGLCRDQTSLLSGFLQQNIDRQFLYFYKEIEKKILAGRCCGNLSQKCNVTRPPPNYAVYLSMFGWYYPQPS